MAMESSSFWCRTLYFVSTDEFYVHPVQEMSGNLTKLEQELQTMAEGEEVAKDKGGGGGGGGECLGCPPAVVVQGSGSQDRPWESGPAVPELWSSACC